jgi:2,3,4,5-tetrahydropyridine-2-carboxylate N-succinyltransferase
MDFGELIAALEEGRIRVAQKKDHNWEVDTGIKQKILDMFKHSSVVGMPGGFIDKAPLKPRQFSLEDHIRMVPGGSSVRAGAFLGQHVVVMPPSYINIGAYIDCESMVDSHVLVGSCAQIGKRVHLSAAVQIGGVLEPIGSRPVIVEDDCFIGAGVILVEGMLIRAGAVLAPGVILSPSVPIYDLVHERRIKGEIPENAVVVPGARPSVHSAWSKEQGLSLACACIVKYRDQKTNAAVTLEDALR